MVVSSDSIVGCCGNQQRCCFDDVEECTLVLRHFNGTDAARVHMFLSADSAPAVGRGVVYDSRTRGLGCGCSCPAVGLFECLLQPLQELPLGQ
jgi:hypothetical protein